MGYEIEMSYDLKKLTGNTGNTGNTSNNAIKLTDALVKVAYQNNCDKFFQFKEGDTQRYHSKRRSNIMIFTFKSERFTEMSNFLQKIVNNYKKRVHIESVYDIEHKNLVYASPYYMDIMEKEDSEQKEEYKHRRQTRSYSETDYFILRDILKKNI